MHILCFPNIQYKQAGPPAVQDFSSWLKKLHLAQKPIFPACIHHNYANCRHCFSNSEDLFEDLGINNKVDYFYSGEISLLQNRGLSSEERIRLHKKKIMRQVQQTEKNVFQENGCPANETFQILANKNTACKINISDQRPHPEGMTLGVVVYRNKSKPPELP